MAHQVVLTWVASVDTVAGYNIFRGISPASEGATPINSVLVTGTTYTDTNVVAGTTYDYYVTAVSAAGIQSADSNQVTATVPIQPPTGLSAIAS